MYVKIRTIMYIVKLYHRITKIKPFVQITVPNTFNYINKKSGETRYLT